MQLLTKLKIKGRVESLLLRPSREGGFEKAPTDKISLGLDGPLGDCHSGETRKSDSRTLVLYKRDVDIANVRQLTLVSEDELAEVAQSLGIARIEPSWFGANIVTSGIPDLTILPPSTRLQFSSGATIVVDMENRPCSQIAAVVERHHPQVKSKVVATSLHKRGLTAWVERAGDICLGDGIEIIIPPQRHYPHIK